MPWLLHSATLFILQQTHAAESTFTHKPPHAAVAPVADHAPARQRSVPSLGPTRARRIDRPAATQAARHELPILAMEQEIMEAVDEHDVILLCGETGCGKTTQVPQFLLEAGYGCGEFPERRGLVGVTQPRRVAAVSTARRVAEEVGCGVGGLVGYQVRFDRSAGAGTAAKFMTDGILLREVQDDFLLQKCARFLLSVRFPRNAREILQTRAVLVLEQYSTV